MYRGDLVSLVDELGGALSSEPSLKAERMLDPRMPTIRPKSQNIVP